VDALRYVDFFFLVAGFLAAFFGALAFLPLRVLGAGGIGSITLSSMTIAG
jgi:hypothetical protein